MSGRVQLSAIVLLFFSLILSACAPAASSPTETPIDLTGRPGSPIYEQLIWDCDTGVLLPADGEPIQPGAGCDSWQINRYERPFNRESQVDYFPDLDLLSAELGSDGTWFYARLSIFDVNENSSYLDGIYAIEADLDLDGRGDILVEVHAPGEEATRDWTVTGVQFYGDVNNDVGNKIPLVPDSPSESNGYDTLVFDAGQGDDPHLAWARLHPGKPALLELAFKTSALYNDPTFKWWAWSDLGVGDPGGADYHDTFDHPTAGDPILGQAFFPSQDINELDNTCASLWGLEPDDDPELCVNDASLDPPLRFPPSTQTQTPSLTATATPTGPTETASETLTPSFTSTASDTATPVTDTATPSETASRTSSATPSRTPGVCETENPNGLQITCTPTSTATDTASPTECAIAAATNNVRTTCTPTSTPSPTPTPTPTSTYCPPAALTNNFPSPCTPTPTPTRCIAYNFAGQLVDCTPTPTVTPTICTQPILTAVLLVPCTPTSTPKVCVTPNVAGQLVNCTPTPTPTPTCLPSITAANLPCPSATPTECVVYNTAGQSIRCSDTPTPSATPTLCSSFNTVAALNLYCTDTPTPTPSPASSPFGVVVLVQATPPEGTAEPGGSETPTLVILMEVTADLVEEETVTPTSTECYVAFAFALVDCTPTVTPTPTPSSTLCIYANVAGVPEFCTPTPVPTATPTYCAVPYPAAAGFLIQCTPTPETAALMVFPEQDTNCRQGPNSNSQIFDTLEEGMGYIPLGRTPDNLYMLFRGPFTNARCWAAAFLFFIPFGPLDQVPGEVLPYISYPTATPTPAAASATPRPPTATPAPQCSDGIDNDGDGDIDYNPNSRTGDRECKDTQDDSEVN